MNSKMTPRYKLLLYRYSLPFLIVLAFFLLIIYHPKEQMVVDDSTQQPLSGVWLSSFWEYESMSLRPQSTCQQIDFGQTDAMGKIPLPYSWPPQLGFDTYKNHVYYKPGYNIISTPNEPFKMALKPSTTPPAERINELSVQTRWFYCSRRNTPDAFNFHVAVANEALLLKAKLSPEELTQGTANSPHESLYSQLVWLCKRVCDSGHSISCIDKMRAQSPGCTALLEEHHNSTKPKKLPSRVKTANKLHSYAAPNETTAK